MFHHHVMFRMRPTHRSQTDAFIAKLRQLRQDVPSIRELRVDRNIRQGPKSFDLYYYVRFDDQAGFEAYMTHPKHIPVMHYVEEVCDAVADVDVAD